MAVQLGSEKFLSVEDIREKVAVVAAEAGKADHESAHSAEDLLWGFVLVAIAYDERATIEDVRRWAHEALQTKKIAFQRWRA